MTTLFSAQFAISAYFEIAKGNGSYPYARERSDIAVTGAHYIPNFMMFSLSYCNAKICFCDMTTPCDSIPTVSMPLGAKLRKSGGSDRLPCGNKIFFFDLMRGMEHMVGKIAVIGDENKTGAHFI